MSMSDTADPSSISSLGSTAEDLLQAAYLGDQEFLDKIRHSTGYVGYDSEIALASLRSGTYEFWSAYVQLARYSLVYPVAGDESRFRRDLVLTDLIQADIYDPEIVLELFRSIDCDVFPDLPTQEEPESDPELWATLDDLFSNGSSNRIWLVQDRNLYSFDKVDLNISTLYAIDKENIDLLHYLLSIFEYACGYEQLMRASRTYNKRIYALVLESAETVIPTKSRCRVYLECCLLCLVSMVCPVYDSEPRLFIPPPCDEPDSPTDGDFIWKVLTATERGCSQPLCEFTTTYPKFVDKVLPLIELLEKFMADPEAVRCQLPSWFYHALSNSGRDAVIFAFDAIEVCNELLSIRGKYAKPKPLCLQTAPIHIRILPDYYQGRVRPVKERDWMEFVPKL